jgi:hypothetical protein
VGGRESNHRTGRKKRAASPFLPNYDLHVVPAGTTSLETAVWKSSSTAGLDESTVEHIFDQIPTTGAYEIWVQNSNDAFGAGAYALAWMMSAPPMGPAGPGDYDGNGSVGPEDYNVWRANFGSANAMADGNGNGIVDAADYVIWRKNTTAGSGNFATVPEPSGLLLLVIACLAAGPKTRRMQADKSGPLVTQPLHQFPPPLRDCS